MARDSMSWRAESKEGVARGGAHLMMRDDEGPGPLTHESAARAPKIRQRLTVAALMNHLELAKRPDLYGGPVVVGEWEEHVVAASEATLPFGGLLGLPLRQRSHPC